MSDAAFKARMRRIVESAPSDEDVMAKLDQADEDAGRLSPYDRLATYYGVSREDPRIMKRAKQLIDKGYDINEWIDEQAGGTKAAQRAVGPVDPRGFRTTGEQTTDPQDPGPLPPEDAGLIRRMVVSGQRNIERKQSDPLFEKETPAAQANVRQLARGADKALLNLPTRLGPDSWKANLDATAAADYELAPGADLAGQAAVSLIPGGVIAKGVGKVAAPALNAAAKYGRIAGAAAGAGVGAAAVPVTGAAMETGQALSDAAFTDATLGDVPKRALAEANRQLHDPVNMGAGILLGGMGGYARGLRKSNSQTGEDIRMREQFGGKPSMLHGAEGGAFDEAPIAGLRGTSREVQQVARESSNRIRSGINKRVEGARSDYGEGLSAIRAKGGGGVDVTDDINEAVEAISNDLAIPKSMRDKAINKVLSELDDDELIKPLWKNGRLTTSPEQLHQLRQRFDTIAETGEAGEDALMRTVAEKLRARENATDFGPLNKAYAGEIENAKRGHELLGMGKGKKTTKPNDITAAKKGARVLRRQGENTATAGLEDADVQEFMQRFPELQGEVMAPQLLAAKNRLTPSILPEGGTLYERFKGIIPRNIEPLEANVGLPLGDAAGKLSMLPGAVGSPIQEAIKEYLRKKEDRDRVMAERFGR